MNKPVVFVDTNCVDNRGSATTFLGGRADLEKISKRAKIILPKVVFDELSHHVSTYLATQLDSLRRNPHRHYLGISDEQIATLSISEKLNDLIKNESIPFEILDLRKTHIAYEEIYRHSIKGTPPFNQSGDKGFKDSLIAKTIDEFVRENPKQKVFLLTKDELLSVYFESSSIKVIKDSQEFDREYSDDKLDDDLLSRVWDFFDEEEVVLGARRLPDHRWLNFNGDLVAHFKDDEHGDIYLLIDSIAREPLSFISEDLSEVIKNLESTGSFQAAHETIAEAEYILPYCDVEQIKTIAQVILANDQIYGIGRDDDISQFAAEVFGILDANGEPKLAEKIKVRYELRLLTKKQVAELPF